MSNRHVIDWSKVETLEDVICILKGMNITVGDDGREIMEKSGVPMISVDPEYKPKQQGKAN